MDAWSALVSWNSSTRMCLNLRAISLLRSSLFSRESLKRERISSKDRVERSSARSLLSFSAKGRTSLANCSDTGAEKTAATVSLNSTVASDLDTVVQFFAEPPE